MGFRTGFVISSVSFLYGLIFMASIYDFPMIYYSPFDPDSADAAERFYLSFFNGPKAITALLHGMMALGIIGLVAKLHRWTENAKYFDGGSLVLFMGAISMYGAVLIPTVKVLADPQNEALVGRSAIAIQREYQASDFESGKNSNAPPTGPITSNERISALQVLAACNTLAAALLMGVVIFQVSGWWLDKAESDKLEKERKERYRKATEIEGEEKETKKDI